MRGCGGVGPCKDGGNDALSQIVRCQDPQRTHPGSCHNYHDSNIIFMNALGEIVRCQDPRRTHQGGYDIIVIITM